MATKSIFISTGYVIHTNHITDEHWSDLEDMLRNNEMTIDELSEAIGQDVSKCNTHFEATVDEVTHCLPRVSSY